MATDTKERDMTSLVFLVEGMMGHRCEQKIRHAVHTLTGVVDVAVDVSCKKVVVYFNYSQLAVDQIVKAIEGAGFEVVV